MSKTSNPIKQTTETARKAKRLRRLVSIGYTWEKAASEVGILKEDGSPDPGLAHRMAVEGYEPKTQPVRDRLGLRKMCMACMRGFRHVSRSASHALPAWRSWWKKLPPDERDKRIRDQYEKEEK